MLGGGEIAGAQVHRHRPILQDTTAVLEISHLCTVAAAFKDSDAVVTIRQLAERMHRSTDSHLFVFGTECSQNFKHDSRRLKVAFLGGYSAKLKLLDDPADIFQNLCVEPVPLLGLFLTVIFFVRCKQTGVFYVGLILFGDAARKCNQRTGVNTGRSVFQPMRNRGDIPQIRGVKFQISQKCDAFFNRFFLTHYLLNNAGRPRLKKQPTRERKGGNRALMLHDYLVSVISSAVF